MICAYNGVVDFWEERGHYPKSLGEAEEAGYLKLAPACPLTGRRYGYVVYRRADGQLLPSLFDPKGHDGFVNVLYQRDLGSPKLGVKQLNVDEAFVLVAGLHALEAGRGASETALGVSAP